MAMKRELVEAIGTAFVVLATAGAQLASAPGPTAAAATVVPAALAAGLGLAATLSVFRRGQDGFHPVLTLASWAAGRSSWRRAASAIGAQLAGAFVAIALVLFVLKSKREGYDVQALGLGAAGIGDRSPGHFDWLGVGVAELSVGFVLGLFAVAVTPIEGRAEPGGERASWALGAAVVVANLLLLPIAGGAFHPAQNLASAAFSGSRAISDLWLFLAMPGLGGVLAGVSSRWLLRAG